MGTKKTATRSICASRTTVNVKKAPSKTSVVSEKSVRILDPKRDVERIHFNRDRKKIKEKKMLVQGYMIELYQVRKREFALLRKNYEAKRFYSQLKRCVLWLLFLWLLLSIIKASVCHSYNPACRIVWYETIFAGVFSCFVSIWRDTVPI